MSGTGEFTCPECGTLLPEGLSQCSHCGATLAQPEAAPLPSAPPVALPEPPPPAPPPHAAVSAGAAASLGIRTQRHATTNINLKLSQATIDKQGWLTPDQWEQLMTAYDQALGDYLSAQMEAGQTADLISALQQVALPETALPAGLAADQVQTLQSAIRDTFANIQFVPNNASPTIPAITLGNPQRASVKASCSTALLVFLLGLMAMGLASYLNFAGRH
jgi:hypothetical protein